MLRSNQHFVLGFFGPPIVATIAVYGVYLLDFWLEFQDSMMMIVMLITFVVMVIVTRWLVRTFIPVACPHCRGRSYEMAGRGGRFMCLNCGRDH